MDLQKKDYGINVITTPTQSPLFNQNLVIFLVDIPQNHGIIIINTLKEKHFYFRLKMMKLGYSNKIQNLKIYHTRVEII